MIEVQQEKERLGDPNLMVGGVPQDVLYYWAEQHISNPTHDEEEGCVFCDDGDNIPLLPPSDADDYLDKP